MENEEGFIAPIKSSDAIPFGYDEEYIYDDLMNLVKENNIYISPTITILNIYNLLLALGIIDHHRTAPLKASISDKIRANNKLTQYQKSSIRKYKKKTKYGILGWEIQYNPSLWVENITGTDWNARYNPILLKNKTWVYHIDQVIASIINKTLKMIRKERKMDGVNEKVWKSLYPHLLEIFEEDFDINSSNQGLLSKMIADDRYKVAMIGWQNHMRFLYKNEDEKSISFFDPWMQTLDKQPFFHHIQKDIKSIYGYSSKFIKRKEDQSEENSCVIDSLARALMVAEYGETAATWKWNEHTYDYALLAARVIHMNMK